MNNLFAYAEACLHRVDIDEKLALTHQAWQKLQSGQLSVQRLTPIQPIALTRFPEHPLLLNPRDMPNRKFGTPEGVAAFFHAIAHVEFMAIYLAWDIIYRFPGLPDDFYHDWLQVADEEAQHFTLLQNHLRTMGVAYGDLPAHNGLWEQATDTAEVLLARLAMVPRCLEARGLDVTPALIEKFKQQTDDRSVAILTRILNDEVGHVLKGSKWFKFVCEQHGFEPESQFQQLVQQYYKGGRPKGPFNRELRIIAGFSDAELAWLEGLSS